MNGGPGEELVEECLADAAPPLRLQHVDAPLARVRVGRQPDVRSANELTAELRDEGGEGARLALGLAGLGERGGIVRVDGVVDVQRAEPIGVVLGSADQGIQRHRSYNSGSNIRGRPGLDVVGSPAELQAEVPGWPRKTTGTNASAKNNLALAA